MTINDIQLTPERWLAFWTNFKNQPQQLAGIEELRQAICQADPGLLTESASWVQNFHKEQPRPAWPISKEQLGRVMGCQPHYLPDELMEDLADCCSTFGITTPLRLAYFLGQVGEESCGLRYPLEIASGADYEGRSDLGNNRAGDGVKFKGAGFIQVTGRHNHQKFADYLAAHGKADPKIMEVGSTYSGNRYPWSMAGHWWFANGMNELCDGHPEVDRVGQRVNGQYPPRGAAERRAYTERAMQELGE
jgi:predicted chitinase